MYLELKLRLQNIQRPHVTALYFGTNEESKIELMNKITGKIYKETFIDGLYNLYMRSLCVNDKYIDPDDFIALWTVQTLTDVSMDGIILPNHICQCEGLSLIDNETMYVQPFSSKCFEFPTRIV